MSLSLRASLPTLSTVSIVIICLKNWVIKKSKRQSDAYSEPCQTYKMERFEKIVKAKSHES